MLVYFIIVPILIGVFLYICPLIKTGRIIAIAAQATLFAFSVRLFFQCRDGEIVEKIGGFESYLGITLRADSLSSDFVMLAAFIFLIASIYSFNEDNKRLFSFLLFVWEGLLIGVLLTSDMFSVFVLIEVVTLTVAVLIMFKRDNRSMYDGIFYLMINTVAVMFFLFGVGYVYRLTGTFDMNAAAELLAQMDRSALILPFALIMTAICLKCALVPLYNWLPKAHSTPGSPSAVSAILSGLHVKASIYLFLRFSEIFSGVFNPDVFLILGILTGIIGFILALAQTDIKLILAYHTVSQIGMMMIGFNYGTIYSYTGALYHVFSHALFKAALFLCAGIIIRSYKTRDITQIRGVFRRMPVVGVSIVMAVLGITGAPFFNGSISKYFIMSDTDWFVNGAILFINLGTIISFLKFSTILTGASDILREKIDAFKGASILILGGLCLFGGIFGQWAVSFLFDVSLQVDAFGYLEKIAYFFASLAAGFFIYKYWVKRSRLLVRIKTFDLSFRAMCAVLGGFFGVLLVVTALVR